MWQLAGLGCRRSPETWAGTERALGQLPLLTLQPGELGQGRSVCKMAPNGPPEKHYQRLFCLRMHQCRGRECYAWHAWMDFQPTQVQTSFSLWERGRWQERKPKGQDVANIQVGRALLWNEHVGRGMGQRNELQKCCDKRDTEIYFKMKYL